MSCSVIEVHPGRSENTSLPIQEFSEVLDLVSRQLLPYGYLGGCSASYHRLSKLTWYIWVVRRRPGCLTL
ncbi:hypothetical protein ANANG_G00181030 [Anguilla anguilla]|uniref:Uncharacterized protein n=1 Tax=Anguilla anguilla TaxID=7936 RepID=A0A9D3M592_ANGAN|nr:hypothetical protein ANANG_G00181030 [Anguilla anguilla]